MYAHTLTHAHMHKHILSMLITCKSVHAYMYDIHVLHTLMFLCIPPRPRQSDRAQNSAIDDRHCAGRRRTAMRARPKKAEVAHEASRPTSSRARHAHCNDRPRAPKLGMLPILSMQGRLKAQIDPRRLQAKLLAKPASKHRDSTT